MTSGKKTEARKRADRVLEVGKMLGTNQANLETLERALIHQATPNWMAVEARQAVERDIAEQQEKAWPDRARIAKALRQAKAVALVSRNRELLEGWAQANLNGEVPRYAIEICGNLESEVFRAADASPGQLAAASRRPIRQDAPSDLGQLDRHLSEALRRLEALEAENRQLVDRIAAIDTKLTGLAQSTDSAVTDLRGKLNYVSSGHADFQRASDARQGANTKRVKAVEKKLAEFELASTGVHANTAAAIERVNVRCEQLEADVTELERVKRNTGTAVDQMVKTIDTLERAGDETAAAVERLCGLKASVADLTDFQRRERGRNSRAITEIGKRLAGLEAQAHTRPPVLDEAGE